jgi:DNA-directed RNA polymerase subunit alpha
LDIRNFGQKSIDEVKVKLAGLGLALKDSPPGFDPGAAVYFADDEDDADFGGFAVAGGTEAASGAEGPDGDDFAYAEDEQL